MKSLEKWMARPIAFLLILLVCLFTGEGSAARAQQAGQANERRTPAAEAGAQQTAGNRAFAEDALPENPAPAGGQAPAQDQQPAAQPGTANQSPNNGHKPVGTAAAPYEPTVGIAASRPAGAAIAPAKQRRVRTILISLGVIAGAGIAVGSIAALSHGSPGRP